MKCGLTIFMMILCYAFTASATPIAIQSLAVMGDVGHTQLVLRLPQPVFYQLAYHPNHNILTITFDNINADSPLLPIDINNTAIQNIYFAANDQQQFIVTLTLMPKTNIQSLRLLNNNFVLDVGLLPTVSYTTTPSDASDPVQPLVKVMLPPSPQRLADENYRQVQQLIQQRQLPAAITLLKTLLMQQPDFLPARISLAKLWLQQGKDDRALKILLPYANQIMPNALIYQSYTASLAEAYRQNNQPLPALALYRQLLNQNPHNAIEWVGLGLCFTALHQPIAARSAYQKATLLGHLPLALQQYVKTKVAYE